MLGKEGTEVSFPNPRIGQREKIIDQCMLCQEFPSKNVYRPEVSFSKLFIRVGPNVSFPNGAVSVMSVSGDKYPSLSLFISLYSISLSGYSLLY